jgi:hypothetical protein
MTCGVVLLAHRATTDGYIQSPWTCSRSGEKCVTALLNSGWYPKDRGPRCGKAFTEGPLHDAVSSGEHSSRPPKTAISAPFRWSASVSERTAQNTPPAIRETDAISTATRADAVVRLCECRRAPAAFVSSKTVPQQGRQDPARTEPSPLSALHAAQRQRALQGVLHLQHSGLCVQQARRDPAHSQ